MWRATRRDVASVRRGRGDVRGRCGWRVQRSDVRDVGNVGYVLLRCSLCTLVPGTGIQDGAERLQNAGTLGTLKRKGYLPVLGGLCLCLLPNHWNVWRSLEVTLEVTVKVTVPILTASAPRTRWQPSLCLPTNFAHFYSETLKESREQKNGDRCVERFRGCLCG
jgi:hypothetical protein